ncbi:MAG: CDP-diacylglycerol--serine O-phosphatidyltransferase [Deltaproteobacteria bacterium]|nr:CDP-diacylglycerol--serine O-phosphatidyltransferase [Deltaproteobacteria bacterium]
MNSTNSQNLEQQTISQKGKSVAAKLRGKAFVIPSLITVMGVFCGFLSAISSFQGNFSYAAKCVLAAIIADMLDGAVARRLKATSEFGKELDSLSDVVAFGVAPAVMLYTWGLGSSANEFGILVAYVFLACGAIRLARFNVTTTTSRVPKNAFQGLPIPGAAGVVVTLCYTMPDKITDFYATSLIAMLSLVLSFLMVSSIPYPNTKHLKLRDIDFHLLFLGLSVIIALAWYSTRIALFVAFWGYLVSGPVNYFIQKKKCNKDLLVH